MPIRSTPATSRSAGRRRGGRSVVDVLEVVEVHDEERDFRQPLGTRARAGAEHEPRVQQARQRIGDESSCVCSKTMEL
jgi:hypothetical protein